MKKALALMLALMMILPLMVVVNAADFTLDGKFDDVIWQGVTWNKVDKTNGQFNSPQTYSGDLPVFAFDWAIKIDAEYFYLAVKINQEAHHSATSQTGATNLRVWFDNDMADTTRSGLYDFSYNGTSCEDTRATKSSPSESFLTTGEGFTNYEVKFKLTDIGFDPAKEFGMYLTVSDINLTDTGDKYDALSTGRWATNAFAPWSTTADYIRVTPNRTYAAGVNNFSNAANIGEITAANLALLTDGDKKLDAGAWPAAGAVLISNKNPTNAAINPRVDLVLNLGSVKSVEKVVLDFYHNQMVMIGLPKDNKVKLTYSLDGITFQNLGTFTFAGATSETTKGTIDVPIDIRNVNAKYIGISYDIGPSPFPAPEPKVVWEFTSLTEVGVVATAPRTYAAGVNNFSAESEIAAITPANLALLTDGDKKLEAGNWGTFTGAVLVQNKIPTNGMVTPKVDLVLDLGTFKPVDKVSASFYHCQNVMIGLPKNNAVRLSYSKDGVVFYDLGRYRFEGDTGATTAGTIEAIFDIADVEARYIGLSYDIGASPFAAPEPKVVWEFTALTEIGVTELENGVVYSENAPDTTLEVTNVALNKDWFGIAHHSAISQYNGEFTDGVFAAEGAGFSYGAPWFSFYRNGNVGNIDYNHYGEVIIDLGDDGKALGGVRMQVAPEVGAAEWIKVYASSNGVAWDEVGTLTYEGTAIQWSECTFAKELDARYIKVAVLNKEKGMFFMASEIEVLSYAEAVLPDAPSSGDLPADYEATLISKDKSYVIISDGGERDEGNYKMDTVVLTDGATHGGDIGGGFGLNVPYAEFILDLGETRTDLFKFAADLIGGGWGIAEPNGITIAVSDDGENFFLVGSSTEKVDNFFTVELDHMVAGRYVKFMCDAGSHVWLSEIEVYAAEEPVDESEPIVDESEPVVDESEPVVDESEDESETPPTGEFGAPIVALLLVLSISGFVVIKRRKV